MINELTAAVFPLNIGLRATSCVATEARYRVHGASKMADTINLYVSGLIKIAARRLPPRQWVAIAKFSDAMRGLWRHHSFTVGEGKILETRLLEACCLLEATFPAIIVQTAIFHFVVHLASHWRKFGPPRQFNCFMFESMLGTMGETIHNLKDYAASRRQYDKRRSTYSSYIYIF